MPEVAGLSALLVLQETMPAIMDPAKSVIAKIVLRMIEMIYYYCFIVHGSEFMVQSSLLMVKEPGTLDQPSAIHHQPSTSNHQPEKTNDQP
jgi:hypothetical protein